MCHCLGLNKRQIFDNVCDGMCDTDTRTGRVPVDNRKSVLYGLYMTAEMRKDKLAYVMVYVVWYCIFSLVLEYPDVCDENNENK